jgi:hypothetical protein
MTGARLLELCKTDNPYCTAFADTLAPLSEPGGPLASKSLASFCPKQIAVKRAIAAFQKFAQTNSEDQSRRLADQCRPIRRRCLAPGPSCGRP